MKINLLKENEAPELTFGDVNNSQLYTDHEGWLCQRYNLDGKVGRVCIATEEGDLCSIGFIEVADDEPIRKILSHITGFNF